jgi:hypothetical protein
MKTLISLFALFCICNCGGTQPKEVCNQQSVSIPTSNIPAGGAIGPPPFSQNFSFNVGAGNVTNLIILPEDSSITSGYSNYLNSLTLTVNPGNEQIFEHDSNGIEVFSGSNLAPWVDNGNLSFTITVVGNIPSNSVTVDLNLCFNVN